MKTRIFLIISLLLLNCLFANSKDPKSGNTSSPEVSIKVYTTPDLYHLSMNWANEYCKLNPQLKFNVIKTSDDELSELIRSDGGIGIFSEAASPEPYNYSMRNMVVGRDVIVPVMNAKNPLLDEVCLKGITIQELVRIIQNQESENWGNLAGSSQNIPLHFYVADDPSVQSRMIDFLKSNQAKLNEIQSVSIHEMISAVQKDPNAMGICKLVQVCNPKNANLLDGLRLVPIDKNGNGKIDYMEDIYDNLQLFTRGIWIGKYPKTLSSNIYSVTSNKSGNVSEDAFLKWVLSDGQQFLSENGYTDLGYNERLAQLAKFDATDLYADIPVKSTNIVMSVLILFLIVIVMTGVFVELAFRHIRRRHAVRQNGFFTKMRVFNEDSVIIPKGLYFDKTHSWAFMRKNGLVKVGIDDFLQHVTGKITRVEMKSAGEMIKKGDRLLSIVRKGKQVSIYSPVSGKISEINKNLISNSSLLNSSPYSEGWVYLVEPTNWGLELQYLTIADNFKAGLKDEFLRLKNFFATVLKANSPDLAYVTMQDGGELLDNPLAELGPEVWDDFQTTFIDTSK